VSETLPKTCQCGKGCDYDKPVIFRRDGMFYVIVGTDCEDWAYHASLNPGTRSITTMSGKLLWQETPNDR
jgi:hypothetical protein